MSGEQQNERVTLSVSTLRAELTSLELRLVDRLNAALEGKADREIQQQLQSQVADAVVRVQSLENTAVKRDGPVVQRVEAHEQELAGLRSVTNYKKWLLVQSIAIMGIVVGLITFFITQATG